MSLKTVLYVGLAASALALWTPGCSGDDDDAGNGETGGADGDTGGAANGGAGAETGTGGTSATEDVLYAFDADDEGVEILDYPGAEDGSTRYVNVAHAEDRAAYMSLDPDVEPEAVWSNAPGSDGEPGVIELTVPFDGYNQNVDLEWHFDAPVDLTGKIFIARIKVIDDGGFVTGTGASGGGFVFAKSGEDWVFGRGNWYTLEQGDYDQWIEFDFELDSPEDFVDGFDPTEIRSVGVQISTGGAIGDTNPSPATVHVDEISIYTP